MKPIPTIQEAQHRQRRDGGGGELQRGMKSAVLLLMLAAAALFLQISHQFTSTALASVPEKVGQREIDLPIFTGELRTGNLLFRFRERERPMAEHLGRALEGKLSAMEEELGLSPEQAQEEMVVFLSPDTETMGELLGRPVPAWVAGLALSDRSVILLRLNISGTDQVSRLQTTLLHEIAHVYTLRATGGVRPPRWFMEGYAIHRSGENPLDRMRHLAGAAITGNLIPLADLDRSFPRDTSQVTLAYSQSISLVVHMLKLDQEAFRQLLQHMSEGESFEQALEMSYRMDSYELEARWKRSVRGWYAVAPLLAGGGLAWSIASLTFLMSYMRKRRTSRRKLEVWAKEEANADKLLRGDDPAPDGASPRGEHYAAADHEPEGSVRPARPPHWCYDRDGNLVDSSDCRGSGGEG